MSNYKNLPAPTPEGGLNRYMQEIRKFPMLEPGQEYMLAKRWVDHEDTDAAHQMVTSHLRLAAKIAMGYRGYGLPQAEVISEANVGLMQAVKRFDPEKGIVEVSPETVGYYTRARSVKSIMVCLSSFILIKVTSEATNLSTYSSAIALISSLITHSLSD